MKKDTVEYWLNQLPEPERTKALEYAKNSLHDPAISASNALSVGFLWSSTKEGESFWETVCSQTRRGLYNFPTPRVTHTIANPSTFRIDSTDPLTVSWEE